MSYPGGPPNGHGGYWNGHDAQNLYPYGMQEMRPQHAQKHAQNGAGPQYTQHPPPQLGQYHNPPLQYTQNQGNRLMAKSVNILDASAPTQAPFEQSVFVNPAQLFSQPPPHSTQAHHHIQHIQQAPRSPPILLDSMPIPASQNLPAQSSTIPLDRSSLVMSLAEEFFDAAHDLAPSMALSRTSESIEVYEKLISTGLACLDTALRHDRLSPRVEANVRLRYAGVLYEETENYKEAENILTKGIALCDMNHYYDLKYAMQLLLAKFMFKKSPKASMKALDSYISNAEAYQHFSWVYALRFLRAAHSLESTNLTDYHAGLQNLQSIAKLAGGRDDRAIYMMACLMEAMAHFKSTGPESMEHAQRAIAAVWAYQLDNGSRIPQLLCLAHILDVACSLRQGNLTVMTNKLKSMQTMMDEALRDSTWTTMSNVVSIPINRSQNSSHVVSPDTRTILGIGDDGRDNLMLSFLNKKDAFSLTYLFCGIVFLHGNSTSDRKGFKYLGAGLESLEAVMRVSRSTSGTLPDRIAAVQWRGQMMCYFNCYMAFYAATITDWSTTKLHIDKVETTAKDLNIPLVSPLGSLLVYLSGVYHQGIGDLDAALEIFGDKKFELPNETSKAIITNSADQVERDIALLAALNSLWILQDGHRKTPSSNASLISRLQPLCKNHPDKDMQTAFNLVMATVETYPSAPLFQVKTCLKAALIGAQTTTNTQLLCITLNVMCNKFFSNVVGDQAKKSAQAASIQAQKSGNILWRSVADGMLAQCYDVNGKAADAKYTMDQAFKLAQIALPHF